MVWNWCPGKESQKYVLLMTSNRIEGLDYQLSAIVSTHAAGTYYQSANNG
jgi:hypothetical protein